MTRIWLCADDYGISPSVNAAIRDLLVRGRINATSVMVVAPSFHRAEALALQALNTTARHVAIGLHVTLSAPFRPLSDGFHPLHNGAFPSLPILLMRACDRDRLDAWRCLGNRSCFGRALPEIRPAWVIVTKSMRRRLVHDINHARPRDEPKTWDARLLSAVHWPA